MKTSELIKRLQELDPEGTKDVTIEMEMSGACSDFDIYAPENATWICLEK